MAEAITDPIRDSFSHSVRMIEFAFMAGSANGDVGFGAKEFFPGEGGGFAAQFVKSFGLEVAEADEHAAGGARPEVDAIEMGEKAGELNAARHGAGMVDAEREQFGPGDVFEAGRGDGEEGEARWHYTASGVYT